MRIGERNNTGFLKQTKRTDSKIAENFYLIVSKTPDLADDIKLKILEAIRWTADDVLQQALDDGYKPSEKL